MEAAGRKERGMVQNREYLNATESCKFPSKSGETTWQTFLAAYLRDRGLGTNVPVTKQVQMLQSAVRHLTYERYQGKYK